MMRKTITTFLLSNDPNGIKKVWVENKNCNCIYLTRSDLSVAKRRGELNKPSLYFLLGEDKKVYIGEAESFNKRITDHNRNKDFWHEALVFTARDNFLSKADIQYLECLSLEKVKEANNYSLEGNIQQPKHPTLTEHREEVIKDFFDEIVFLSGFLHFSLLEVYTKNTKIEESGFTKVKETIWYLDGRGIKAQGVYEGNKFIILAGAQMAKGEVPSFGGKEKRQAIIADANKVSSKEKYFELKTNIEVSSPSGAAGICLGKSANGWTEWKNKEGKTMDDILR